MVNLFGRSGGRIRRGGLQEIALLKPVGEAVGPGVVGAVPGQTLKVWRDEAGAGTAGVAVVLSGSAPKANVL